MPILSTPALLWQGSWIPPIRYYGGSVSSFADIILEASGDIFPSHFVSRFDLTLGQEPGNAVSVDIAIVAQDLGAWYLLFLEPSTDSSTESLMERLEIARNHPFGPREAYELEQQIDGLDLEKANRVVQNHPDLLVVTDNPHHSLNGIKSTTELNVKVMVVEPFYYEGNYVVRINGDIPTRAGTGVIGICEFHEHMSNCLLVTWTNLSAIPNAGPIILKYGAKETEWDLIPVGPRWQLQPKGYFPLYGSAPFEIVVDESSTLSIRNSPN